MADPFVSNQLIAVLASGGLDSCILISDLLCRGCSVQPLYIRSNLIWEQAEIQALRRYLAEERSPRLRSLVLLDLPLSDLYGRHWSLTGEDPPSRESAAEEVFLPGRNALLVVKAAIWCQLNGVSQLALAPLATSPFADAKGDFFRHLEAMLDQYENGSLRIVLPFAELTKREVMERGRERPLGATFSCISPAGGLHCGRCNKCAERQRAFGDIGQEDPTRYATLGSR
jgi:7-cyano-7-deazaguanine synthase